MHRDLASGSGYRDVEAWAMLSDKQREEFGRLGFVRVPGVFDAGDAAVMCDRLWEALAQQYGCQRYAPETWTVEQPRHLGALKQCAAFDALTSPALCEAIDDLLGAGAWRRTPDWGSPLVTFPRVGAEWNVPHAQWHLDFPARGHSGPLFGLKLLAFIAPMQPGGGGTVILAGSHHLIAGLVARSRADKEWHSPAVREAIMRSHPWLRELMSKGESNDRIRRFMQEDALIDGVSVRVVELTGAPGDAVLMHPWMVHAPAANCCTTPRMMVSGGIFSTAQTASGSHRESS